MDVGTIGWYPENQSVIHQPRHYLLTGFYLQLVTADARLRIVSERVDIIDNLIVSVSIGPPNSQFLKSKDKSTWSAKDVADSVLSDKSALRITSSQRMAESSVLDAHSSETRESNSFRHYISSTVERDGKPHFIVLMFMLRKLFVFSECFNSEQAVECGESFCY
ncbi:PsbP domain protein [Actinidia rufa]|uniref:PsbP domain protein n=1 Tax=Actinidia rufa TaxID=165716 RepID=A0A7J0GCJ1_9ERIC|nr:PsbP domain protein [Actinidia rufa]